VTLLFISCIDKKQKYDHSNYFILNDFQDKGLLSHEVSNIDSVYKPLVICNLDSVLIISDTGTDYYIQCYDKKTGQKIVESLPWGNGPDDMNYITSIQNCEDSLFIFNSQQNKYMLFDKKDLLSLNNVPPGRSVVIKGDPVIHALILPGGNVVTHTFNPLTQLFSVYDPESLLVETKGDFPDDKQEYPFDFAKRKAFDFEFNIDPNNKKIVVCYKLTDLIEIYDLSLNLIKRMQGPDYFFPITNQIENNGNISAGAIFGTTIEAYGRPVITENEIWVLYSGNIMGSKPNGYLKDVLFVFDLNGVPLRRYQLDIPIFRFDVDPVENKIYAITDIPEFRIVTFQI
jgi:WD40 repeat protein